MDKVFSMFSARGNDILFYSAVYRLLMWKNKKKNSPCTKAFTRTSCTYTYIPNVKRCVQHVVFGADIYSVTYNIKYK